MITLDEFRHYLEGCEEEADNECCECCANRYNCRYEGCNGYEEE